MTDRPTQGSSRGEQEQRRGRTLDEATVEDVRKRIGIPQRNRQKSHIDVVTADTIRHYALGYGDDNPLYCEPDYAATTSWRGVIGAPMFASAAGSPVWVEWTPEQAAAMRGGDPLGGMGQYMCGERWVFARPIRPGMQVTKSQCLDSAELKHSEFADGVGALVSHRIEFRDRATDSLLSTRYIDYWHAERDKTRSSGKYRNLTKHVYSADELAEIDRLYEEEQVQGSSRRRWADLRVGDSLGVIAKGPFLLTDMITYHVAIGWGGFGGGSSRVAYKNRRRIPKFYTPNAEGVPDSAQRCHWDQDWAESLGHPAPYDYGAIRCNWMVNLLTNWVGDDGWIWKMSAAVIKFNYFGDWHRIQGHITDLRTTPTTAEVDVEVEGINQRGQVTCRATATVLLPLEESVTMHVPDFDLAQVPPAVVPTARAGS